MTTTESTTNKLIRTLTYEEAISATGVGRFHYYLLATCGLAFMATATEVPGLSIIILAAKCDLNFSLQEQGLLASAGFFGILLSCQFMGYLADKYGRVKIMRTSLMMALTCSLCSVFSVNTLMLISLRFSTGLFIAGNQAAFSLIAEYHGRESRAKHLTFLAAFLVLGSFYFRIMATIVLPLKAFISTWRLLLIIHAIPTAISSIGLILVPESPKFLLEQGKPDECLQTLREIHAINTKNTADIYNCDFIEHKFDTTKAKTNFVSSTAKLFNIEHIFQTLNLSITAFIITFVSGGIMMWLPLILSKLVQHKYKAYSVCGTLSLDNTTAADGCVVGQEIDLAPYRILAIIGFIALMLYVLTSFIVNNFGRKGILAMWLSISGNFTMMLYWSNFYYINIAAFTSIIQVAGMIGIVYGMASENYPTSINATGVGFVMVISRLGSVCGSYVLGPLLYSHCDVMFLVYGGLLGFTIILVVMLPKKKDVD